MPDDNRWDHRDGRESDRRYAQRDQNRGDWGRGDYPSEDRGGYGEAPGYGYGRGGQGGFHREDRPSGYGYGREGQEQRRGEGRGAAYGYGRQGDDYRPGSGGGFGGPGVGYHQQPGMGYRDRDREGGYRSGGTYRGDRDDERGFLDRTTDEVQSWFDDDDAAQRRKQDDRRSGGGAWTFAGEHRGRGPRNYVRADERVRDDINDRLSDDPHIDASEVEVTVSQGEVTLAGTVSDRQAKRHAEDIAERVSGVKHVQNNLRVQPAAASTATPMRQAPL